MDQWRTNKIGNNVSNSNASDSFQSTEFLVQSSTANVHIFAYDSRRPPGFTTTVAIDSNLLGIDFHSQPVVLPAVEVFGEVRLGECFDAFVCGLMPRLHPPAARTSPPGLARPWRLAGWRRRMEC